MTAILQSAPRSLPPAPGCRSRGPRGSACRDRENRRRPARRSSARRNGLCRRVATACGRRPSRRPRGRGSPVAAEVFSVADSASGGASISRFSNGSESIRRVSTTAAATKTPQEITIMAIVPAKVCSSRVVSGIRNPWLAITRLTRIRAAPTSPGTIVPGKRKISTAMQATPRTKSKTSSQSAVPPRKWLQNKSRKQAAATNPPTPWPGRHGFHVQPGQAHDQEQAGDQPPVEQLHGDIDAGGLDDVQLASSP